MSAAGDESRTLRSAWTAGLVTGPGRSSRQRELGRSSLCSGDRAISWIDASPATRSLPVDVEAEPRIDGQMDGRAVARGHRPGTIEGRARRHRVHLQDLALRRSYPATMGEVHARLSGHGVLVVDPPRAPPPQRS